MRLSPHNSHHQQVRPAYLRLAVAALAISVFAVACGGSDDDLATAAAAAEPIETNQGGVLVKPPDVLDGEPAEPAVEVPPPVDAGPLVEGAPLTPIVEFTYFDGTQGSTADFKGRPTVINFWASNCAPCVAEMPEFEAVHLALAETVDFVGMNVDDTSRDAAVALAAQTGVTYPLVDDSKSLVFREFGGFVMPTTAFLNAQGQVAYIWNGILTSDDLQRLIAEHISPESGSDA